MKFPIFFAQNTAPSTTNAQIGYVNTNFSQSWTSTANEAQRQIPVSEAVTVSEMTVYLDTAPGSGKSRTYTLRVNGADTAASITISDTNTTGSWTGSVAIAENDLVSMGTTPSGTPTAPGNQYITMQWNTTGQKYLVLGSNSSTAATGGVRYATLFGGAGWVTSSTTNDLPAAIGGTITKARYTLDDTPGAGTSYAVTLRINDTTDALSASIADTATAAGTTGSQAITAGDNLTVKVTPSGTPTARRPAWCFTFEPTTNGESFYGYGSNAAMSTATAVTEFEQPLGIGASGWNASESGRLIKVTAGTVKNFYVRVSTAPGVTSSRSFNLLRNSSDSTMNVAVTSGTTGSDSDTMATSAGDTLSIRGITHAVVAPAAANGHFGWAMVTTQPAAGTTPKTRLLLGVG